MFSILRGSVRCLCALSAMLICLTTVSADIIFGKDAIKYGKVTKIDRDSVSIRLGCDDKGAIESLPLNSIRNIKFTDQCKVPEVGLSIPGLNSEECPSGNNEVFYMVNFGREGRVYASQLNLDDAGNMIIDIVFSNDKLRGPITKVRLISRIITCRTEIPTKFTWPREFSKL